MADHPILFIPGPTEVEAELRQIMARPLVGHRESAFVAEVQTICKQLQQLFLTQQPAAFETCPATALMEAAVRNFVPHGGRALHLVNGAFSDRWAKIGRLCGRKPEPWVVPMGHAHDPAALRDKLLTSPPFEAVFVTHSETSTGVLQQLAALAAVVREVSPETLVLADVVTSVAGAELRFDDWGLDFAFAGTQKCLALPPGITVFAASERALQRASKVDDRGFLFDLPKAMPETIAGKTLATPCVPLVFALKAQLDRIASETLAGRWRRHLLLRDTTLAWAERHGITPFVRDPLARSPSVTCLEASGHATDELSKRAKAAGFKIDQGYGDLKGKTFRIGHMGDHGVERLETLLTALLA